MKWVNRQVAICKGELLKVDPLDMSQSMGWTALEIAHKETVDAAHKALDKAMEPARKAYEEAEEAAFKAFKAKAKTLGFDLSKREVEGLWIVAAKVKSEQTRRKKRRWIITRLLGIIAKRKYVRKTSGE